jgi:DNA mismatch repair ATPase MutS
VSYNNNCLFILFEFIQNSNQFTYSYKLHKGISNICGGVKILRDMDYPKEIIDNITAEQVSTTTNSALVQILH